MNTATTKRAADLIGMIDHLERTDPNHTHLPSLRSRRSTLEVWIVHHGGGRGDQIWDAELHLTATGIVDAAAYCEAHDLKVALLEFKANHYQPPTP